MKRSLALLLSVLLPCTVLAQGLKMVNEVTNYGQKKQTNTSTLYLTDTQLKTDSKTNNGAKSSSIFKQEEEVLYTIDHRNERYTKITKDDIEQMQKMMKRVNDMPESAKEMMGERMKKMMQSDKSDIEYKKTGNTKSVAPWGECQEWKGTDSDGNIAKRVYTTGRDAVKMRKEHFDILTDMIDFFDFMPEGMDMNYPVKKDKSSKSGLEGFGVLWIHYGAEGEKTQKMQVREMKEKSIDKSHFELPDGYDANEMNMGRSGRR